MPSFSIRVRFAFPSRVPAAAIGSFSPSWCVPVGVADFGSSAARFFRAGALRFFAAGAASEAPAPLLLALPPAPRVAAPPFVAAPARPRPPQPGSVRRRRRENEARIRPASK